RDGINPWFMIVDNADDVGVFFNKRGHDNVLQNPLTLYLPKSIHGKILVTSRSLDAAESLTTRPLSYFGRGLNFVQADKAAAVELVRALDCIPLVVNYAAAYINRRSPRVTVASYLDGFWKSEKSVDSLLRSDKGHLSRHGGVTFGQIRREYPRAANLLMSEFLPQHIPESMLHSHDSDVTASNEGHADYVDS
ncbi:hypothetical protein BN1708_015976, partial [Verticillium longisporum]